MKQVHTSSSINCNDESDLSELSCTMNRFGSSLERDSICFRNQKEKCSLILNVSAALDGCDDQLLPASFRVMEAQLGFYPTLLGHITLAQLVASSISCPIWGYIADRYSRKYLLTIGLLMWGAATIGLGFASDVISVVILRVVNGMFLGCIGPIGQSILADICEPTTRGYFFGVIQMCSCMGRVFGGILMTSAASLRFKGYDAWRLTFGLIGWLSFCLGIITFFCFPELPRSKSFRLVSCDPLGCQGLIATKQSHPPSLEETLLYDSSSTRNETHMTFAINVIRYNFKRISIFLILLEGVMGVLSWSAMAFLTLFFQYKGLSDVNAGVAASFLQIGAMVAGPLAGLLGDSMASRYPYHGRVSIAQLAILLRIPLSILLFYVSSFYSMSSLTLGMLSLLLGLCCVGGVVVNRPLLTELVIARHRASVFSIIVAIEVAVGSLLGMSLMGLFTERFFGYVRTENLVMEMITESVKEINARALGNALVCLTCAPYFASFVIYGFLHLTYKRDLIAMKKAFTLQPYRRQNSQEHRHYHEQNFASNLSPYFCDVSDFQDEALKRPLLKLPDEKDSKLISHDQTNF